MGYPIVNSVEGPLVRISKENLTEGCITRCMICSNGDGSDIPALYLVVAYVLLLNSKTFLIDYSNYIVEEKINEPKITTLLVNNSAISLHLEEFPNRFQ